ncbi:MAG: hypothetical protein JJE13_13065 [Thermoleophilia bacterium]|nr:hypothetical protein [Thermoleophilia bacterium]
MLNKDDARVFSISANSKTSVVYWYLKLEFVHRGNQISMVIDSDGSPLVASPPPPGRPEYTWAWFEQPPRLMSAEELESKLSQKS